MEKLAPDLKMPDLNTLKNLIGTELSGDVHNLMWREKELNERIKKIDLIENIYVQEFNNKKVVKTICQL